MIVIDLAPGAREESLRSGKCGASTVLAIRQALTCERSILVSCLFALVESSDQVLCTPAKFSLSAFSTEVPTQIIEAARQD